jgi:arylformamidase
MMKIYDISLPISPHLPTWPGDPIVKLDRVQEIESGDDFNVTHLAMSVHTGTHVDAPNHLFANGDAIDKLELNSLTGNAYVLDLLEADLITSRALEMAELPMRVNRVLFKTRNSRLWERGVDEFHPDFVGLDPDAAHYLVDRGIKLVGVDYLSVAPFAEPKPTHEILLKAGVIIVEGLDLSKVDQGSYTLFCLPLNIIGAEGAPARAILLKVRQNG